MRQARWLIAAASLGVLLGSRSASAEEPLRVDADIVTMRGEKEKAEGPDIVAEGHVHATRGALQLRAPLLEIDRAARTGLLSGGVIGVDGLVVFFAKTLRFDVPNHLQTLSGATFLIKKYITAEALEAALNGPNPGCVRTLGNNALTLRARVIERHDDGNLDAQDVWFTNCSCGEQCIPLLSVSAWRSHIVPEDRASFVLPMLRLFDVPVLPLPWISFPLTNRATGLLFPVLGFNGPGGISLGVPVFITLGDSVDLTLEPLYYFGTVNADAGGTGPQSAGVKGFGDDVELRWRPAQDALGSLHVLHVYDWSKGITGTGVRGNRASLDASHVQGLLGGRIGAALNLTSDSDVRSDTQIPVQYRYEPYLRSYVEYTRILGPVALSFESLYIEDLESQPCQQNQTCAPRTPLWQIPGVVAPVARLNLGGETRLGRLLLNEQLELADEDAPRWLPTPSSAHSQRLQAGAVVTQTLPLLGGRYGSLSLDASERAQLLSIAHRSGADWRAGGFLGLFAQTRIARTFASGWVHDITPSLRLRAYDGWGSLPFSRGVDAGLLGGPLPQDGWDLAVPSRSTGQLVASLGPSVTPPHGQRVSLSLEQHVAVYPFDAGQLRLFLVVPFGANRITLYGGRVFSKDLVGWGPAGLEYHRDLWAGDAVVRLSYGDGRTDDQLARGPDLLFTPRFEVPPAVGAQSVYDVFAGLTLKRIGPFSVTLTADVRRYPNATQWLVQDYKVMVAYEVEGCGVLRLTVGWTWAALQGQQQPLPLPIPTPEYLFGDTRDITRGVASAVGSDN
jgi:hypothetical protein